MQTMIAMISAVLIGSESSITAKATASAVSSEETIRLETRTNML